MPKRPLLLASFIFVLAISCSQTPDEMVSKAPQAAGSAPAPGDSGTIGAIWCSLPDRASLNNWFTVAVSLHLNNPKTPAAPAHITTDNDDNVTYKPAEFDLNPGQQKLIKVKVNKSRSGIAAIVMYADGNYLSYNSVVDVGFQGHLKLNASPYLSYGDMATMSVGIVDMAEKPLPLDAPLTIQVQAGDALLSEGIASADTEHLHWADRLVLPVNPGARSSPQFRVRVTRLRGGSVHVAASLSLGPEGAVLAQDNFSVAADPAWWLPILMAIGGSLLYGAYSFVQSPKTKWMDIALHFAASIIGGIIAYLFAGYDLLGLKLDPNVLKTYPLLGFIFSYAGIEILLAKKFKSGAADQSRQGAVDNPQDPEAGSLEMSNAAVAGEKA